MSESAKHWAENLQVGDTCLATIRHKTDGSKNIFDAKIIVVENEIFKRRITGWDGDEKMFLPYNELTEIKPHEYSSVKCDLCSYSWVAVRPEGLKKLECPNCGNLVHFENE